jgi:hypothetical protein
MTDGEKIEKLKPFSPHKYENLDLDRLVIYAVGTLEKIGADISFENAVVAAFKLFPKKFSLPGFPSYPDGKRVHDSLFRCTYKTKKWLGGKTRQGFTITDRSRAFIKEAEDLLRIQKLGKTKAHSRTRRKELLIAELERSPAYTKYLKQQFDLISEADLCYLLQGTLDSSRETLKENFFILKKFTEELKREEVLKFLSWLEERFKYFLYNSLK